MYNNYFGLSEAPFSIAPDPRFLYMSEQHREALAHLLYGISSNGGFVLLTGEVGTGKTTVSRCLLEQLPDETEVALVLNPKYTVNELLSAICDDLGISYSPSSELKEYVDALNTHLLENYRNNRHTVLIIDEAQNLSTDVLETIRLLTNLETNTQKLLQIILIGQPELLGLLDQPELRQLNQRITARYHLRALQQHELHDYISHRLSIAGVDCQLFPESTIKRLYKLTKGIPRLVNIVCDRALLGAYVQRENQVKTQTLGKAANEVFGSETAEHQADQPTNSGIKTVAAVLLIAVTLAVGVLTPQGQEVLAMLVPPETGAQKAPVTPPPLPEPESKPEPEPESDPVAETQTPVSEDESRQLVNPANWIWADAEQAALTQVLAYQQLMQLWGVAFNPRENPAVCQFAESQGLRCLFNIAGIDDLIRLNRPAVIKLFNPKGQLYFATLETIEGDQARLSVAGQQQWVALDDLKLWLEGSYTLLWRKPDHYSTVIQPGSSGPVVTWLDRQLAITQGREPRQETEQVYDNGLVLQVRRFQSSNGLMADGVVGPHTAIQLNTATRKDIPLLLSKAGGV